MVGAILATDMRASLALRCWQAGLSVLPLLPGTPLVPAINTWRHFLQRQPNQAALTRFESSDWLVGIATGQVSGGLEVLDFEQDEDWHEFRELVELRQPGLLGGLPLATSVAGVVHLYYRCENPSTGVLAVQPLRQEMSTPVLRVYAHGDHSFVPAPDNGRGLETWRFEHASGPPLETIPRIEVAEHLMLHEIAGSLDRSKSLQPTSRTKEIPAVSRRPGITGITVREDFNCRGHWDDVLYAAGWQMKFCRHGGLQYWTSPTSITGGVGVVSGVQGDSQTEIFNLVTPSDRSQEWPSDRNDWTQFRSYAALLHDGDQDQAGRSLWALGFGNEPDVSWVDAGQHEADAPADVLTKQERTGLSLGALWRLLRGGRSAAVARNTDVKSRVPRTSSAPKSTVDRERPDNENTLNLLSSREVRFTDLRSVYVVKDLIVAGKVSFLSGSCDFQKNALMADLALSAAQQFPFLDSFDILQSPRRVLFMVGDVARAEILDLTRQIAVSRGTDLRQAERLSWSTEPIGELLCSAENCRAVTERLVEERVDLLLVAQGDMGERGSQRERWLQLQRIAVLTGAAIVCDLPGRPDGRGRDPVLPASTVCMQIKAQSDAPATGKQSLHLSRKAIGCPDQHWEVTLDHRNLTRPRADLWQVRAKSTA